MKEIYTQTPIKLRYTVYVDGVPTDPVANTVSVKVNDVSIGNATRDEAGKYSISLPSSYNAAEGFIDVLWSFNISSSAYAVKEEYSVVTPYVGWDQFQAEFAQYNQTYADYQEAERVARYIIHAYCGQEFGKIIATYDVDGSGDDGLPLPKRLLSLTDVSWWEESENVIYVEEDITWEIAADGWLLRKRNEYRGLRIGAQASPRWPRNRIHMVEGTWGYKSVPAEIVQAARLLIKSYVCPDQAYRNKYIDNIKSGEWRIQYTPEAWAGTGDANVDDILKSFRLYPLIGVI